MKIKTEVYVFPMYRHKRISHIGVFPPDKTISFFLAQRRFCGNTILHILDPGNGQTISLIEKNDEEFQNNVLAALGVPRAVFNGGSKYMKELVTPDAFIWVIYTLDGRVSTYRDGQFYTLDVSDPPFPLIKDFRRIQANSIRA